MGVSRLGEQQQWIVEAQEGISSNAAGDGLCQASSGTLFVIKRFEKTGFWAAAATTQGLHPPCSVRDNRQTLTPQWTLLPVEETPRAPAGKSKKPDLVSAEEGAGLAAADLAHGVFQVRVDLNLQEKQAVGTGQCWGQPPAPGGTNPLPWAPQIHHQHPQNRQSSSPPLAVPQGDKPGYTGRVTPGSATVTHTFSSPGCTISPTHLFSKLGCFDFHKRSGHRLQIAALVVEGDTARPWNKPDER